MDRYKDIIMLRIPMIVVIGIVTLSICADCNNNDDLTTELYLRKPSDDGPEAREAFSPRVDYNEWMPVGRGDPLKNDPTYDYSPPVLNRVRYWASEANRHENAATKQTPGGTGVAAKDSNHENKNEILVLGVPSKRQSYRKETKYQPKNTVRRSYYVVHHNLPTRLMPPPMQTIAPLTTVSVTTKSTATEAYPSQYMNQNYHHHTPSSPYNISPVSSSAAGVTSSSHYQNPTWGYNKYAYDTRPQESISYVSITRPDIQPATKIQTNEVSMQQPHFKRKPWIHELLQKEIAPKTPATMNHVSSPPTKHTVPKPVEERPHQFYQHTTAAPITFTTAPVYHVTEQPIISITTTTNQPTPTFFEPTVTPIEVAATTDSIFSHYKQPGKIIHGPMYLIIEGHSNVKTYGLKDNDTKSLHKPKIRPVSVKEEDAVIKHVVLKDDKGNAMEVKHLHKHPNVETNSHLNENIIEKDMTTKPISVTEKPFSPIGNLLNLFDTSFGGFFANENNQKSDVRNSTTGHSPVNFTTIKPEKLIDSRTVEPVIFVTTTEQTQFAQERKDSRQMFDYDDDQMTESNLFEFLSGDYDDYGGGQTENIIPAEPKNLMDTIE